MPFTLSLNTNPFINRFAEPEDLIETIARLRIRDIQLTNDFLNPSWPASAVRALTRRMSAALRRTGVRATSCMTGPYARLNHFGHPEREVRRYSVDWFKSFADIAADLGAPCIGTQFAIFTYRDFDDPARREALIRIALDCWAEVAEHARAAGLSYLFWEPMSVGREFGETIESCLALQRRLDAAPLALPLKMMADVDHGDVMSANPSDYDPYAWARAVPRHSPIIHIKQSMLDKGGHRPFVAAFNANGRIQPEPLLAALRAGGGADNELCLELSFKEREPNDRQVLADIAESIAFWRPYVETGAVDLIEGR
jgi:sugar phosphate isomerase/epimerase